MKLLIVDDEEITREGLINSLPFEEIGITEIVQAKDGFDGIEKAREEMPDIILCDIRMPKMDGLAMLARINEFHDSVVSVLLTGHAEIDYLKKAISLNVINYIEKPVNVELLTETLKKAVMKSENLKRQKASEQIHSTVVASRLAYQMTYPYKSCKVIIDDLYQDFLDHYGTDKFKYVTTFVVRPERFPSNSMMLYSIGQKLHDRLLPGHFHVIYTDNLPSMIVYQIYGAVEPKTTTLKMIGDIIVSYYSSYTRCFVSVGGVVSGVQRAFLSYNSAMEILAYRRFYEENSVLLYNEFTSRPDFDSPSADRKQEYASIVDNFYSSMENSNQEEAHQILGDLRDLWYHSLSKDGEIKSVYYSMFNNIGKLYTKFHIVNELYSANPGEIIDYIDSAFTFEEVHVFLKEKTDELVKSLSGFQEEETTIYRIKDYISNHYMDHNLSVKSVSENVFLSVSYLCTYFKSETGVTLNQYITDYRIRKALNLLSSTNMKIIDVSSAVGYKDSNYFAKLFKKQTGMSPKEYKKKFAK